MAWLRTGIVCRKAADYLEDALRQASRRIGRGSVSAPATW